MRLINPQQGNRGFTLFEMLVSIGIFTLLTSVLLVKNSQFKGNILITNLAYQIATVVRQAQAYGVNVRGGATDSLRGDPFSYSWPYGVRFAISALPTGGFLGNDSFALFADKDSDGLYTLSPTVDPVLENFNLQQGNIILRFTGTAGTNNYCAGNCSGVSATLVSNLDITFKRPDPKAIMYVSGGSLANKTLITSAQIIILSPRSVCKGVQINSTGQISILDPLNLGPGSVCPQ